jgi:CBS domain-containing protein
MHTEIVGEVMHRGTVTCAPSTSVEEAVRILSDGDVGAVVVVGNAGELLGIVSHSDILRHYGEKLAERQVGEIMNPAVLAVQPDTPLRAAIGVMLNGRVNRLVVSVPSASGNVPVGVLSSTDIIRHLRGSSWAWKWQ